MILNLGNSMKIAVSLLFTGSLLASFLVSCSSQQPQQIVDSKSQNDLLPNEVVVKYEHNLLVADDAEKINGIDYVSFITDLSKKLSNSSVTAYDPIDPAKDFGQKNIDYLFASRKDTLFDIDEATLDTVPTVKEYVFHPEDIQRLVISESWFFNAETFEMTKTIKQYAPIRISKRELGHNNFEVQKHMLFWIKSSDEQSSRTLLASDVTYEFDLYNMTNPNWMESLSVGRFVNIILSNVLNEKVKAYDFFATDKTAIALDIVRESLGATIENYYVEDDNAVVVDTVQVIGNIYPDEIRSVIFVEDWFVDEKMMIHKVVKRIAPVRHYYLMNEVGDDEVVKKVPFVVDLNY